MRMSRYLKEQPKSFEPAPSRSASRSGIKKAVNVSVDAEILKLAKEMRLNLSQALEDTLRKLTEEERARRFYEENKAFIDHHNALVEKYGTLSEVLLGLVDDDQTV